MSKKLTLEIILSEINNKNISNLTAINIHGKNINDISLLSKFPTLEIVSLFKNSIKDLAVFKHLKNLKILNLRDNEVSDFSQIESLKNCKQLESLSLKENPISKEQNYFQKIKELLPQLKKLDDIELNKNLNKENKILSKTDNKKIDKLNMITNKFIKYKNNKNKNSQNKFSNASPNKPNTNKNVINLPNSSGKKNSKEIKEKTNTNSNSNKKSNIEKNDKKNNDESKTKDKNEDDEIFENININAEKQKIEKEIEKEEKNKPKSKSKKRLELLNYSFKKKRTTGTFYKFKKKSNLDDANATLDNIKIDNQLINTFNDENKNLNYSLSNSRYSRKIIGKFPGGHSLLSQSIRYDDENEDENNEMRFSQKSKLVSIKNRLFSKLTNQIYNKKINNINENEKIIIKSIKLLLGNLNEEELKQINNDIINAISKINK